MVFALHNHLTMRASILATVIAVIPGSAAADDVVVQVDVDLHPPGEQPPAPPPPPPAPPHRELTLHVGANRTSETFTDWGMYDRPGPRGTALLFDASAGLRLRPWLSVAALGALSSVSDDRIDNTYAERFLVRNRYVDVGAKAQLHAYGAFVGALAGVEIVRASYDWLDLHRDRWYSGLLVGVEAGYVGRAYDGVAPELSLALTYTSVSAGPDVFPEMTTTSASVTSARAGVGVRF